MEYIPWALFAFSGLGNAIFFVKSRKKNKDPRLDLTAQDLLHDLTRRGVAILKVEVIDPSRLMLRSPRS